MAGNKRDRILDASFDKFKQYGFVKTTVEEIAKKIASCDPRAVRYAKQAILRGLELPLGEGLNLEKRLASELLPSLSRESINLER